MDKYVDQNSEKSKDPGKSVRNKKSENRKLKKTDPTQKISKSKSDQIETVEVLENSASKNNTRQTNENHNDKIIETALEPCKTHPKSKRKTRSQKQVQSEKEIITTSNLTLKAPPSFENTQHPKNPSKQTPKFKTPLIDVNLAQSPEKPDTTPCGPNLILNSGYITD